MKKLGLIFSLLMMVFALRAQEVMDLYSDKIPNAKVAKDYIETSDTTANNGTVRIGKVSIPKLIAYYPEKEIANGTAVIICPGGGYTYLSSSHEGSLIAKQLNTQGITAFVLKYRLPSDMIMVNKAIGPLQDAEQAIKVVRENAAKFHINPNKIGIMGFSAGGHLASTLGTQFKRIVIDNPNQTSLRPDFMVLGYPVITMGKLTHAGSKRNLLGDHPTDEMVKQYSNELQVSADTPPTFIVQAVDDKTVPVENSLDFTLALKKAGVKCELILYPSGGHGFGLVNKTTKDFWFDRLMIWLRDGQWVN